MFIEGILIMNKNEKTVKMLIVNIIKKKYKKTLVVVLLLIALVFWVIAPILNLNDLFSFKEEVINKNFLVDFQENNKNCDGFDKTKVVGDYSIFKKYSSQIEKMVNFRIKSEKEKAKKQSLENKTNFDDEWKVILASYDVKNDKELFEKIKNEIKKNYFYDELFANRDVVNENKDGRNNNFLNFFADVYNKNAFPHHIKEIFVGVKDINSENVKITKEEADNICNVVSMLIDDPYSFENASYLFNDDNNLKLRKADRVVDVFSKDIDENVKVATMLLGCYNNDDYKSNFIGEETSSFSFGKYIKKIAECGCFNKICVEDILLLKKCDDDDHCRNLIFNRLFGMNNANVITSMRKKYCLFRYNSAFKYNSALKENILYSENDPVLVICGKKGLHFVKVVKNPYPINNECRYFTPYIPNDNDYPKNNNNQGKNKKVKTYVWNDVDDDVKTMRNRSNEVRKSMRNCCYYLDFYKVAKNDKNVNLKKDELKFEGDVLFFRIDSLKEKKCEILKNEFKNYYFDLIKKIKNNSSFDKEEFDKLLKKKRML